MSINSIRLGLATTAALAVTSVVAIAPAEALVFNFAGASRTQQSQFVFNESGISVTAKGFPNPGSNNVVQNTSGLGVRSRPGILDIDQIDGRFPAEAINLSFSKTIRLISATFASVDSDDDFSLFLDGNFLGSAGIPGGNIFDFSPFSIVGDQLGFGTTDLSDDYYLSAVEVKAVPTPAAVLPVLLGMGTAALRKKKHEGEEELAITSTEDA
ncbi:MAG: PTPA-CTERM sorting domain-containing protein [Phormidesmis sp.]